MSIEPRRVETAAETAIAARIAERTGAPAAIAAQRIAAGAFLAAAGLPSRRVEAYRYTDLRAALRELAPPPGPADAGAAGAAFARAWDWDGLAAKRLVFVDGRFSPELSDLAGLDGAVEVAPLGDLLAAGDARLGVVGRLAGRADDPVVALNSAFWDDGALIRIAPGATVADPLALVHLVTAAEPVSIHVRHVVSVGEGATVRVIEHHAGPDGVAYLANAAVELSLGKGARVTWARLQEEGDRAIHLASLVVDLGEAARLDNLWVTFGAALSREQGFVRFAGRDGRAAFETATHVDGRRHADHTLFVDHAMPDGQSRERFRSVVGDDARAIVQGKIMVAPGAQRTDAKMMTQAIMTGDGAEVVNKPELEIFADDVQCGHGATSGRLDETALFYMRTRGIPRPEAEALLLEAFLAEAIEGLGDEAIAAALLSRLSERLAGGGEER
jgi:Fe-S cluster assembly protein SufD